MRVVVFDIDGTLLDSRLAIYLQISDWFKARSLQPPTYQQVMKKVHGTDLRGMLTDLLPQDHTDSQLVEFYALQIDNSYTSCYLPRYATLIDGAIECLLSLKESGYKIAFVTNSSRLMMNRFLQMSGLYGVAEVAISADDVSKPKPHPMGILKVFNQLNIEPEDGLFVGDSTTDIFASKAANVLSVGVLSGVGRQEELQRAGADFVIKSVAALLEIGI